MSITFDVSPDPWKLIRLVTVVFALILAGCGAPAATPAPPSYDAAMAALKEEAARLEELQAVPAEINRRFEARVTGGRGTTEQLLAIIEERAQEEKAAVEAIEDQAARVLAARAIVNEAAKREGQPLLP